MVVNNNRTAPTRLLTRSLTPLLHDVLVTTKAEADRASRVAAAHTRDGPESRRQHNPQREANSGSGRHTAAVAASDGDERTHAWPASRTSTRVRSPRPLAQPHVEAPLLTRVDRLASVEGALIGVRVAVEVVP